MDLERLRRILPASVARDLEKHWARYGKENPGSDTTGFAADLHRKGLITNEHLREVLTSTEVSFTLSEAKQRGKGAPASSGRYELLGLLGKGAMGEVHVARDVDLHRNVAFKRLDPAIAHNAQLVARFQTEVQITAQLDHPAIVAVYGLEADASGIPAYAMKLIRGRNVEDFLEDVRAAYDKGGEPDEDHDLPARLAIFLTVCDAMAYAHARGVLHRDLKPENIMVGAFHQVVVMDWGIAKLIGGEETLSDVQLPAGKSAATQLGMAIGTPAFMSPEQALGKNVKLDARSDQYALGLILFEIVSLRRALSGKTAEHILYRASEGEKDPLVHYSRKGAIPRELEAIIHKATARKRKDRYADVDALADDVRLFLRDEAVSARPDRGLQRVTRWISHHRGATLGVVVALMASVVGVGVVAVAGGLGAIEVSRYAAGVREERLGDVLAVVNRQTHRMDTELQRYEALLVGLGFAAEHVLTHEPEPRAYYLSPQYAAGTGPPDLADSKYYKAKVSVGHPDMTIAPDLDAATVDRRLQQLAMMQPHLLRAQLRSASDGAAGLPPAKQVALVTEEGVPAVWAYVGVEEGILAAMPGIGVYPSDYDPRTRPWYKLAKAERGAHWSEAYVDESGMGLVVPCAVAVRDESDRFLGVAGIDVTVGWLVDNLLDPPELTGKVEAYLVNDEDQVVVQSSQKQALKVATHVPPPFPWPVVRERVEAGEPNGHIEVEDADGTQLIAWSHLESVDWTYVIVGPSDELLGAW